MGNFTRREAVGLVGLSAVLLCTGCFFSQAEAAPRQVRPPGAPESEKDFLALCNKCQKCLMVCETGVIEIRSMGDSVRSAFTPVLNFSHSWCNFCGKCYEVCPTGALVSPVGEKPHLIGEARVNKESCIAWSWSGCTVCSEVCPEKAIEIDESMRPIVVTEKCNGCGLCELKCPNASIRSFSETGKTKGIVVIPKSDKMIEE